MPKRRYSAKPKVRKQPLPRRRSLASRVAGWVLVALGITVAALNYAMDVTDVILLPTGHQELYFLLGLLLVIAGLWFTGLGDAR